MASLLDAYERARPLKFFQQWRPADLIAAGIPREWLKENGLLEAEHLATSIKAQAEQSGMDLKKVFALLVSERTEALFITPQYFAGLI